MGQISAALGPTVSPPARPWRRLKRWFPFPYRANRLLAHAVLRRVDQHPAIDFAYCHPEQ